MKTNTPEDPALSETPITDANAFTILSNGDHDSRPDGAYVSSSVARALERDNAALRADKERLWVEFSRLVTAVEVGMTDEGRAGYNKQILERAQAFWKSATLTGDMPHAPKGRVGQRRVYAFTVATCLAEAAGWVMAVQDDVRKPITITAEYWDLLETAPEAREVLL